MHPWPRVRKYPHAYKPPGRLDYGGAEGDRRDGEERGVDHGGIDGARQGRSHQGRAEVREHQAGEFVAVGFGPLVVEDHVPDLVNDDMALVDRGADQARLAARLPQVMRVAIPMNSE